MAVGDGRRQGIGSMRRLDLPFANARAAPQTGITAIQRSPAHTLISTQISTSEETMPTMCPPAPIVGASVEALSCGGKSKSILKSALDAAFLPRR